MPQRKSDTGIGKRMVEELFRLFPTYGRAAIAMKASKSTITSWAEGVTPGGLYLARAHYAGADVIYILTGRKTNGT